MELARIRWCKRHNRTAGLYCNHMNAGAPAPGFPDSCEVVDAVVSEVCAEEVEPDIRLIPVPTFKYSGHVVRLVKEATLSDKTLLIIAGIATTITLGACAYGIWIA